MSISFLPSIKELPSFLNKAGMWQSSDGSLYSTPQTTKTGLLDRAVSFVKNQFNKNSVAQEKFDTFAKKVGVDPRVVSLTIGATDSFGRAKKGVDFAKKFIERGFITSAKEAIPELETRIAGQYVPRSTDRLAIKAKNFITSDIATAERIALTQSDDNAVAIASELIKKYSDDASKAGPSLSGVLYDRAADVANTMARKLTNLGRSVQAASILGKLTPEGQVRFAAREIQKYNEAVETARGGILGLKRKIPELSGDQSAHILNEMKIIDSLTDGAEKAIRFQKLQDYISELVPSSLYQKMIALWKAGLLTGVKTSGLNIFANTSHAVTETIKDIPATAVDSVASLFTGERTKTFTTKGIVSGIGEGFEKGLRYLKTGFDERNIASKLDYKKVNFGQGKVAKALQSYEETVFRVLGTEDQPFYYGAKARSIADQAKAQAKTLGLKGEEAENFISKLIKNPTDKMSRSSVLDAEIAVFQNDTVLGRIAKAIQKAPGGEIVVPFGRTPSAVATQILNYTPVGIVKTIAENIGKGRFDQRLFSQGIGRGITGTVPLWIGAELAKKGLVSLDRPTTEREKELWNLEGRKPNSIKIDGKWRSPTVLGPVGNLLLVGAHFQKAFETSGSPTEALSTAIAGSAKSFTEQTFLIGVNQVVNALNDPARSAEGYLGSALSSIVPTVVSDVARAIDSKERRTETILDRIKARLPRVRESLEPQVDILGKEEARIGNPLEVLADPTRPYSETTSPVIEELRRLVDAGQKVSPTKLGDKNGFNALNSKQNTDLWKRAGEITNEKLASLFSKEQYRKLDDEDKGKIVEDIVDKSKLVARVEKVIELTHGLEGSALKKKLSELKEGGLMNKEVYTKYMQLR